MAFAVNGANKPWRGGIVPFVIHSSIANDPPSLAEVRETIDHWNSRTCLQIVPHQAEPDFVEFKKHDSACKSPVGCQRNGKQLISCAVDSDDFDAGSVIDEIGHAVGLHHEQKQPDRDLFVVITRLSTALTSAETFHISTSRRFPVHAWSRQCGTRRQPEALRGLPGLGPAVVGLLMPPEGVMSQLILVICVVSAGRRSVA